MSKVLVLLLACVAGAANACPSGYQAIRFPGKIVCVAASSKPASMRIDGPVIQIDFRE